jgi:hypothetical protein
VGNAATTWLLKQSRLEIQRVNGPKKTKKERIKDEGFTDQEAEQLKAIIGGWDSAFNLVSGGLKPHHFRTVIADLNQPMTRKLALENLSEHYYCIAKNLCWIGGVNFAQLVQKRVNDKTVDAMTGYPVPAARGIILSLVAVPQIADLSGLGRIFTKFPRFGTTITAQVQGQPGTIASLITWLGQLNSTSLAYLEINDPTFAVLQVLYQRSFDDNKLLLLAHFSKENPPGNNEYEDIGTQFRRYRVGHFARYHTIQGMSPNNALTAEKTIWPLDTTVENVREICEEFDGQTMFTADQQRYFFTPTVVPVRIAVDAHGSGIYVPTSFDQMYPTQGPSVSVAVFGDLTTVYQMKNDWTEP